MGKKIIMPGEQQNKQSILTVLMQFKNNLDAIINIVRTQQNEIAKMKKEIGEIKELINKNSNNGKIINR